MKSNNTLQVTLTRCQLLLLQKRPSPQTHMNVGVMPIVEVMGHNA
jgi:hypothetical protein